MIERLSASQSAPVEAGLSRALGGRPAGRGTERACRRSGLRRAAAEERGGAHARPVARPCGRSAWGAIRCPPRSACSGFITRHEAPDRVIVAVRRILDAGVCMSPVLEQRRLDNAFRAHATQRRRAAGAAWCERARVQAAADADPRPDLGRDGLAHQPLREGRGRRPRLAEHPAGRAFGG